MQTFEQPDAGWTVNHRNLESDNRSVSFGKIRYFFKNFRSVEIIKLGWIFIRFCSGIFIQFVKIAEVIHVQNLVNRFAAVAAKKLFIKKNTLFVNVLAAMKTVFWHVYRILTCKIMTNNLYGRYSYVASKEELVEILKVDYFEWKVVDEGKFKSISQFKRYILSEC